MTHVCKSCGYDKAVALYEGGLCKKCFDLKATPIKQCDMPKRERKQFDIETNQKRKMLRIKKALISGKAKLRFCAWCSKEFYYTRSNQIYCCIKCKRDMGNMVHNERKRQ